MQRLFNNRIRVTAAIAVIFLGGLVEAGSVKKNGQEVRFTVTDTHQTLAVVYRGLLPDLFERFTRADTARTHAIDAASTGLGLAIVDAVVAAHEGAVLVTSWPGMTRFTIVLARLSEPASDEGAAAPRPARKMLHRSTPGS